VVIHVGCRGLHKVQAIACAIDASYPIGAMQSVCILSSLETSVVEAQRHDGEEGARISLLFA